MTVTEVSEEQIQDTCPSFCERTEHENMGSADSPVMIHSTGDHNVHGVIVQISTGTDDKGKEVEDCALSVLSTSGSSRCRRHRTSAAQSGLRRPGRACRTRGSVRASISACRRWQQGWGTGCARN